jgi:1-acyl-sn-glycerol-3-phosphate acyltransferase
MANQVQGVLGKAVDAMIRRSVRRTFRNVYWQPPARPIPEPAIYVPNHHGWHDGYLMYLALSALGLQHPFHDWIQEFDAFPLFGRIGGMPFPLGDPAKRAATIRQTIRLMREERRSLMLFAEGVLHRPPELLPFGKSLELVANKVPGVAVIPVAIRYEHNVHERPEASLLFGSPMTAGPDLAARTRLEVWALLDRLAALRAVESESLQILHPGTLDVNERMDMRRMPGRA